MIIKIIIITLLIILGIIFSMGKGTFLIAGFNMMSQREKETYDVISLCKLMGKLMFMFAFCVTLFLLSEIYSKNILFNIGLCLFFASILFTFIYSNTSSKFRK